LWMRIQEFVRQRRECLIIQVEVHLECPIGHTLALAEEYHNLIEDSIQVHRSSSRGGDALHHRRAMAPCPRLPTARVGVNQGIARRPHTPPTLNGALPPDRGRSARCPPPARLLRLRRPRAPLS